MLTSAGDRAERQERKVEEHVEREERDQEWYNTHGNTSRSTRRWCYAVARNIGCNWGTHNGLLSGVKHNSGRYSAVLLLAAVWGSMDAFGLSLMLLQRAVVVRERRPAQKGVSGHGRSQEC